MRIIFLLTVLLAIIPLGSCGDGGSARERLRSDLALWQDQLEFRLLLPDYLPDGTRQTPQPILYPEGGITLDFWALVATPSGPVLRADVTIIERTIASVPTPPPAPPGFQTPVISMTTLGDRTIEVWHQEEPRGSRVVLSTEVGAVAVTLEISWRNETAVTDEMEQEAFKVMESLLEDA